MTLARHTFAAMLALVATAIVFSPLTAALVGAGVPPIAEMWLPLARSIAVALTAAVVALVLGTPFAIVVERASAVPRRVCRALAISTLIVPPYLTAEAAIVLLGPAGKLSRGVALLAGFGPPASDLLDRSRFTVPGVVFTWPGAGVVLGASFFPIVALAVAAAYRRTDHRTFDAARLARGRRGVASVAAHALLPPAIGAALLVFAIALAEFAVPQVLRVRTIGEAIYERIQEGDIATAAALGTPLLPIVVIAGAGGAWLLVRSRGASIAGLEGDVPTFAPNVRRVGRDVLAIIVAGAATAGGFWMPLTSTMWLLATSTTAAANRSRAVAGAGFVDAMRGAWALASEDAIRTLVLASVAAVVSTSFAVLLARVAGRTRWAPLLGVLGAGLAVPAPIVGLGIISLWNRGVGVAVYQSDAIVLLAWFARFLPVSYFLAQAALSRVPRELEEAASLMGRSRVSRFVHVVLPIAAVGLIAAGVATYVLCATELGATLLVSPPGRSLLAPSVVNLIRRGQDPAVAACEALLLGVVAFPLLVIGVGRWIVRRR